MSEVSPTLSAGALGQDLLAWCRTRPLQALLGAALIATLVYYYCFFRVFNDGLESTFAWMRASWNPENDLEHGFIIFPAAVFIVWYHRAKLAAAPKSSSWLGLAIAAFGVLMYIGAVRTLQPRIAIFALPVLFYGSALFLWGPAVARIVFFPCLFLIFLVPLGFLISRTVYLQTLTASFAAKLATFTGIPVEADGAALRALDGTFQFEVAGGCSGVRSLTAMTMLAALYVHFTQNRLWKQWLIFGGSLFFALVGNLMRIASVVYFAKLINPQIASGLYHDYSGFIFFPFAVGAMVGFSNLVNRDWSAWLQPQTAPSRPAPSAALPKAAEAPKPGGPISYDY